MAHLAGGAGRAGLGAPCRLAPDWRWLRGREDSPWYPTMRLFRQPAAATGRRSSRGWPPSCGGPRRRPRALPSIAVEVAPGELIDKITILEIKGERIRDPAKRGPRRSPSWALLAAARDRSILPSAELRH